MREPLPHTIICDVCFRDLPEWQASRGLLTASPIAVDKNSDVIPHVMCWRCSLKITVVKGGSV